MLPLYDEAAPRTRPPFLTLGLILINVLVFLICFLSNNFETIIVNFGLIPERVLRGEAFFTFLTSMFLHGNLFHLISNMWFLWLFGDNLEYNLGSIRFCLFYFITGIIAALVHILTVSLSSVLLPVIGASGAISGVLGGYVILFPGNKIRALMFGYFRPYLLSVPAWFYASAWFFYQLINAGTPTSIAYTAHIGGFIAGIILAFVLKKNIKRKNCYFF